MAVYILENEILDERYIFTGPIRSMVGNSNIQVSFYQSSTSKLYHTNVISIEQAREDWDILVQRQGFQRSYQRERLVASKKRK
jgi:hypothetical protein